MVHKCSPFLFPSQKSRLLKKPVSINKRYISVGNKKGTQFMHRRVKSLQALQFQVIETWHL